MKRFIAIILALVIAISLMGCASVEEANLNMYGTIVNELGFTVLQHAGDAARHDCYIVYDNETNVVYYLSFPYATGITLCPRYDENGEVMIYRGE